LGQTRTDFQLLIVDDASQDGTVNEAEKIKDSRIRLRSNPQNLGLGLSLARALDDVDTEYVALLNSDDLFHPLRLERCLAPLEENTELAMVATALSTMDSSGRILSATDSSPVFDGPQIYQWLRWYDEHACTDKPPSDLLGALLERNFLITTSNLVARTEFLRRHRESWQDLEFCVDWHIFLMAALDRKLRYLGDPLLGYRLHQTNTVWFDGERRWRFFLEVNQVMARILESLFQHYSASGAGLNDLLRNVSEHLSRNTNLDWAGVVVGLFSERLHLRPRDFEGSEETDAIKSLATMRDQRVQITAWYQEFGNNIRGLYRMRGEYPFLRTIRNQYEALRDDHDRLKLSSQQERDELQKELRQHIDERDK
jgi:glycosyltransferase involved in cell wall biosynthesis